MSEVWFLTVKEVAAMLRVSEMTIYRLVKSGELESVKVGRSIRIYEHSIAKYLGAG